MYFPRVLPRCAMPSPRRTMPPFFINAGLSPANRPRSSSSLRGFFRCGLATSFVAGLGSSLRTSCAGPMYFSLRLSPWRASCNCPGFLPSNARLSPGTNPRSFARSAIFAGAGSAVRSLLPVLASLANVRSARGFAPRSDGTLGFARAFVTCACTACPGKYCVSSS